MDSNSKEMKRTVPFPSVGADGEQLNDQINITSIAEKARKATVLMKIMKKCCGECGVCATRRISPLSL